MFNKFLKNPKGQTSLEILIVMGGLIIIAVVVVTIILASSKSKVTQITDADRQNAEIIDKTLFPPNINSVYCIYANNQVTYNLSIIPSVTKDLAEYCLVVNGTRTDNCVSANQTNLSFTSSEVGNGNYKVALVSKNINNGISSNSVSFSCKVDLPTGGTGITPPSEEYPTTVNFSCPAGYSRVPGSSIYSTNYNKNGFCVMTWEAKMDYDTDGIGDANYECINIFQQYSSTPPTYSFYTTWDLVRCPITPGSKPIVSTSQGMPLSNTTLNNVKAHCSSLGANYHLITNEEWMTIARNLEYQPANWVGGVVGVESLKVGNTFTNVTSNQKGYGMYGLTTPAPSFTINWDGNNYNTYLLVIDFNGNPSTYSKRTETSPAKLVLSTGDSIWDFSGNMLELVDKTILGSQLPRYDQSRRGYWVQFSELNSSGALADKDFKPSQVISSENGAGRIVSDWFLTSNVLFLRGGGFAYYHSYNLNTIYSESAGGIYSILLLEQTTTFPRTSFQYTNMGRGVGFRCVYIPQ